MILSDRGIKDKAEIEEIIQTAEICHLGLVDGDIPYVLPMNFAFENNVLYLHSGPDGKKVDVVAKNNNVCVSFDIDQKIQYRHEQVACSWSMRFRSVLLYGQVETITDYDEKVRILNLIMAKYAPGREFKYNAPAVKNVLIWKIPVKEIYGKKFI